MTITTKPDPFLEAEFTFHAPVLRLPEAPGEGASPWDTTLFDQYTGSRLLASEDFKGNLSSVLSDPKVGILAFTPECLTEISYLCELFPRQEWAIFLTMKRLSHIRPHFLAFDWFMPGQHATAARVDIQSADANKYFNYLLENYPEYYTDVRTLHNNLAHLHSHNSLGLANFSDIDNTQQFERSDLGFNSDFRFYVLVLNDGRFKASLVTYRPVLYRTNAALAVFNSNQVASPYLSLSRRAEIKEIVHDAMWVPAKTPVSYAVTYPAMYDSEHYSWWDKTMDEDHYDAITDASDRGSYVVHTTKTEVAPSKAPEVTTTEDVPKSYIHLALRLSGYAYEAANAAGIVMPYIGSGAPKAVTQEYCTVSDDVVQEYCVDLSKKIGFSLTPLEYNGAVFLSNVLLEGAASLEADELYDTIIQLSIFLEGGSVFQTFGIEDDMVAEQNLIPVDTYWDLITAKIDPCAGDFDEKKAGAALLQSIVKVYGW